MALQKKSKTKTAAKSKAKKRPYNRKSKLAGSLPESLPLPLESSGAGVQSEAGPVEENEAGGLFSWLGRSPSQPGVSSQSVDSSAGSFPEPLSAEVEAMLSQIPDTIGGELPEAGPNVGPINAGISQDEQLALVAGANGPISDKTGRAVLTQIGGILAQWRDYEEYKAGFAAYGESCGEHLATVANAAWARWAPLLFQTAENSFPGLAALVLGAVPLIPIAIADFARVRAVPLVAAPGGRTSGQGPQPVAQPAPAPRRGIVFD